MTVERKESDIENPTYEDKDVIYMLQRWGEWHRENSRLPNLGFPKSVPFIWERVGGVNRDASSYVEEYGEDDALPLLINQALGCNKYFKHVAEISYAFNNSRTSTSEKAKQLRKRNVYLGSSLDSCRKKYTELEKNLHSFIQGFIRGYEINIG